MVSDLEFELDDKGNITKATLQVYKCIDSMDQDDLQEYLEDLFHLRFHIMNDEVDIVNRYNSIL